jgi:hypothetical protein
MLPIVVGTVPRRRRERRALLPSAVAQSARPPPPAMLPDPAPAYDEPDLPPSYMESIECAVGDLLERGDISHSSSMHGNTRFVPLYAYVNTPAHATEAAAEFASESSPPAYAKEDPFPLEGEEEITS